MGRKKPEAQFPLEMRSVFEDISTGTTTLTPRTREKAPLPKPRRGEFKYVQVKTDLSIHILEGRLRPHDRIPSLNEIVEKYGVSKITARRVLQELMNEGLVYVTRGSGTFVADAVPRRGQQLRVAEQTLGVVFAHAFGAFMSDIILGIDEEAFSRNAQISLSVSNNSYEREAEILQRLARQGVRRILMFLVLQFNSALLNPNVALYLKLQESGIKLLFIGCNIPGVPLPAITYDEYNAYRKLVKLLHDKGRKQLCCVVRDDNASSTLERVRGFKDGLLENGLSFSDSQYLQVEIESHDTIVTDATRKVATFLRERSDIDAFVCSDEMIAAGVFEAIDSASFPPDKRPLVGGMGILRNLHVLKGRPYILLEEDTRRMGREATALILEDKLSAPTDMDKRTFHKLVPVPVRVPKTLKF